MQLVWIIGAVAWWSTALVHKDGPFDILLRFRLWTFKVFGQSKITNKYFEDQMNDLGVYEIKERSPLVCTFCTGFWVLLVIYPLSQFAPYVVQFFGILGIAAAVRGMSNEY